MASIAPRGVDMKAAKRSKRTRRSYPWNDWLDGKPWLLIEGEDYDHESTLRSAASYAAERRGVTVRIERNNDSTGKPGVILQRIED